MTTNKRRKRDRGEPFANEEILLQRLHQAEEWQAKAEKVIQSSVEFTVDEIIDLVNQSFSVDVSKTRADLLNKICEDAAWQRRVRLCLGIKDAEAGPTLDQRLKLDMSDFPSSKSKVKLSLDEFKKLVAEGKHVHVAMPEQSALAAADQVFFLVVMHCDIGSSRALMRGHEMH